MDIYLEIGKKRTLAGAIDWPGWLRGGRDEQAAIDALFEYAPRYARVLRAAGLQFEPPATVSDLAVVERLAGNATTDLGAPDAHPAADIGPVSDADVKRLQAVLEACWQAFDAAARAAAGKELRKGPRGGGRDLDAIVEHVLGGEGSYLARLGRRLKPDDRATPDERLAQARQAVRDALAAAARGELPERGPRGGAIWPARFFVRRSAWHVLDHAWEIEDRAV